MFPRSVRVQPCIRRRIRNHHDRRPSRHDRNRAAEDLHAGRLALDASDGVRGQGAKRNAPAACQRQRRVALGCSPLPIAGWGPKSANYVTLITDGRGAGLYIGDMLGRRGEHVMTWTSDRAGVVLYTVLGMIIVLSSIYIPA
jgi:hypothetical protein